MAVKRRSLFGQIIGVENSHDDETALGGTAQNDGKSWKAYPVLYI